LKLTVSKWCNYY